MLASALLAGVLSPRLVAAQTAADHPGSQPDRKVVLVTLDGVRVQELFGGMDEVIASAGETDSGIYEPDVTRKRYWRATPQERREALMPFFWKQLAPAGMVLGNQALGSTVKVRTCSGFRTPATPRSSRGSCNPTSSAMTSCATRMRRCSISHRELKLHIRTSHRSALGRLQDGGFMHRRRSS
jgi:hypothetical protein